MPKAWGGKRKGAGAHKKPKKERAVGITIYRPRHEIEELGGKDKTRELLHGAIDMVLAK